MKPLDDSRVDMMGLKKDSKGKTLFKATVRRSGSELRLLETLGVQNVLGLEDKYKYAYTRKQALYLFTREYPIDSILELKPASE